MISAVARTGTLVLKQKNPEHQWSRDLIIVKPKMNFRTAKSMFSLIDDKMTQSERKKLDSYCKGLFCGGRVRFNDH